MLTSVVSRLKTDKIWPATHLAQNAVFRHTDRLSKLFIQAAGRQANCNKAQEVTNV